MEGPMGDAGSVSDSSPLQIFVRAKNNINDIFMEIEDYVRDAVICMQSVQHYGSIVKSDDAVHVEGYIVQVTDIQNILLRDNMKVAFLGRTSNGKSTVINAMLREKIFPSGYGHTTSCFLQVEGSDSGESYLVVEGSTEKRNVAFVGQLAHALCEEKLKENQLVHIYWPKDKCLLLRDNVVIIDSPGFDMSTQLNEWINRYCLDADVFVLVVNAVSILTLAEKRFFLEVLTRLSKPNIFILNNFWDVVSSKCDLLDQVRAQHMERAVEFLVEELKACTQKEANQRIFFVSAEEALQARLQEQRGLPAHGGALADGILNRYLEFQDFEQKFEECISKSAVRTKFERHSQRGKLIVSEIQQFVDRMYDQVQQLKTQKDVAKKEIHDKLNITQQQLLPITQEMKDKIQQIVEAVEEMVSKALSDEIGRLSVLVDGFNLPFNSEQEGLSVYKKELLDHVKKELVIKLHARLSTALAKDVEKIQREMTEQMSRLLPVEKKLVLLNTLIQQESFEILYRLNCDNLCDDLQENLEFSFMSILPSLLPIPVRGGNLLPLTNDSQQDPSQSNEDTLNKEDINNKKSYWSRMANVGKRATGLALCALAATEGVYAAPVAAAYLGAQYVAERWMWNIKGKEEEFKKQFVAHVKKQLQLIVDEISVDCSHQVEQELSETFEQLRKLVDEVINDMDAEIKTLDKEIKQLEEVAISAEVLRHRAIDITRQLEIFEDTFLNLRN